MAYTRGTLKQRFSEWTNPWLIVIGIVFLLMGVPMVLWIMTYQSDAAVAMFVITWASLTFFVVMMAKRSLLDARFYADAKVIEETKREIRTHRLATRKDLLKQEIEVLARGERTPVLDVWRLDHELTRRHHYFAALETNLLDPQAREMQMRIQLGELEPDPDGTLISEKLVLKDLAEFLVIVVRDPYLHLLTGFFERAVVELDSLREDEHHVDRAFPVLSFVAEYKSLVAAAMGNSLTWNRLQTIGDMRFEGGKEIEPHRIIQLSPS